MRQHPNKSWEGGGGGGGGEREATSWQESNSHGCIAVRVLDILLIVVLHTSNVALAAFTMTCLEGWFYVLEESHSLHLEEHPQQSLEGRGEGGRERGESDARWSHNSAGHGGNILHWTV